MFLIITNDLSYQISLYLFGPGGTGKSVLSSILQYLLGDFGGYAASLQSVSSRFGSYCIKDKLLLILQELPLHTGFENTWLNSLVGGINLEKNLVIL